MSTSSPGLAGPSLCSTSDTLRASDATMPRPAELAAGVEPRLDVRKGGYGGGCPGLVTGHWSLVAGQGCWSAWQARGPLINSSWVVWFPLSSAARVPVPHSALFLIWQSLRRQAAVSRCTCPGTIPIGWDTGFCSRISLISAGTQNRALDLQRCSGRPQTCAGRNMHRSRRSTARKF